MWETERFDVAERVAVSKARLSDKLRELARRVDNVRETADKASIVKEPWFLFAAAAVTGLALGLRRGRPRAATLALASGASARVIATPSLGSLVIREVVMAAAGAMTRRYIARLDPP